MDIQIDVTSHVPIYIQLMDQVKHMIATGDLVPGDQLPTVRQLAADLRVNFNTVARAYRMLDDDGIISTQHGRGTFILKKGSKKENATMRKNVLDRLTKTYILESMKLGFQSEDLTAIFQEKLEEWKNENPSSGSDPEVNQKK